MIEMRNGQLLRAPDLTQRQIDLAISAGGHWINVTAAASHLEPIPQLINMTLVRRFLPLID